jgi:serine/threonine protein kinase
MEYDANRLKPYQPRSEREAIIARTLGNRYHIIKHLGEGGSGATVFAVYNKFLDRIEALKVLSDDLTWDSDFIDRFKVEAKISASLAHPNIVTIYEYQNINNLYFFTMLYIDGPPLTNFIRPSNSMPARRVCATIATVCDAINYAHQRGVIHRDLKVSNIILDLSGKPYVTDFGIAKWEKSLTLTHTGQILGSPHYVSPEQAAGREIDARSDIYALGVTLYVLLTHHYPFSGDTPPLTIAQRLYQPPIPPQTHKPDMHPRLIKIIDKALQKKRRDRYQTAMELARDLNDFVQSGARASKAISLTRLRRQKLLDPSRRLRINQKLLGWKKLLDPSRLSGINQKLLGWQKLFDPSRLSRINQKLLGWQMLFDPSRRLGINKKWLITGVAMVVLAAAVSLLSILKHKDPAIRTVMEIAQSQVQARSDVENEKSSDKTNPIPKPVVQNNQQGDLAARDDAATPTKPSINSYTISDPEADSGLKAGTPEPSPPEAANDEPGKEQQLEEPKIPTPSDDDAATTGNSIINSYTTSDQEPDSGLKAETPEPSPPEAANDRPGKEQQVEEPQLPAPSDKAASESSSSSVKNIEGKNNNPADESKNTTPENKAPDTAAQLNFSKDLSTLADNIKNAYGHGEYEACLKMANTALDKLKSLPAARKADYSDRQVEINQYKTLSAQKLSQQKFEQDLNYLVAKTKRDFQDGDYTSCMYNSKTALSKIESLGAKQRKRYAAIQREMVAYKSKAVTAIQIRQRQLAVLQKIKKNIAEDNLEEANSLVDAMLVQPTNLSPDVHEALLSYREKIKKLMQ